jgi:tRNA 5-methylaminomethyl-2-thiouridine biosynthesis bifunctional protein
MLVARYIKPGRILYTPEKKSATVIGAGLAGAAVCERLCARGWSDTLLERHAGPAREASGNHAGAFRPLVSPDDSVFARVTRAAFLASLQRWPSLEARWESVSPPACARRRDASPAPSVAALACRPTGAQLVSRDERPRRRCRSPPADCGLRAADGSSLSRQPALRVRSANAGFIPRSQVLKTTT